MSEKSVTLLEKDIEARQEASTNLDVSMFVDAGAGTGKTRALTDRVFEMVTSGLLELRQVAVVTFTEKAARELRDRLRTRFENSDAPAAKLALEQLDSAAIGTLHSFAKRILGTFPIEARLPLRLDVMDDNKAAQAARKGQVRIIESLAKDPSTQPLLQAAAAVGVRSGAIQALIDALTDNFDLIPQIGPQHAELPKTSDWMRIRTRFENILGQCLGQDDKLYVALQGLQERLVETERLAKTLGSASLEDLLPLARMLREVADFKMGGGGSKAAWGRPAVEVRRDITAEVLEPARQMATRVLSWWIGPLTSAIGSRVIKQAQRRARSGQVFFHDLLVLARQLLVENAQVRAELQNEYRAIFLDEFQDTDPLQIEIALRIAGGADAFAENWWDIQAPAGSLFIVGDPKQAIYAFRRADVQLYRQVQRWLPTQGGLPLGLARNFRSSADVINWVNKVCEKMFAPTDTQAPFVPLIAGREEVPLEGPAVMVLEDQVGEGEKLKVDQVREHEAAQIAGAISQALNEGWQVRDVVAGKPVARPIRPGDIAVLFKVRSGMELVEDALAKAGIPYHSEARTRAYLMEVSRWLLLAAQVVAQDTSPADLVALLRTPIFGCADDDLLNYRGKWGHVTYHKDATGPVANALSTIENWRKQAATKSPAQMLETIIAQTHLLQLLADTQEDRVRESYGALRQLVDDARALQESQPGSLRDYVAWARMQADRAASESEPAVPESDLDAVRLTTIHASKGLEYPMVVLPSTQRIWSTHPGPKVLWDSELGCQVSLGRDLETPKFKQAATREKELGIEEVQRLLYVAATRAKDHLVVSLCGAKQPLAKGGFGPATTLADLWLRAEARGGAQVFTGANLSRAALTPPQSVPTLGAQEFERSLKTATKASQIPGSATPTRLPRNLKAAFGQTPTDEVIDFVDGTFLEHPPTLSPDKSGEGTKIGTAVHHVLAQVSLTGRFDKDFAQRQVKASCALEGETNPDQADLVSRYVASALASDQVRLAMRDGHAEIPLALSQGDDDGAGEVLVSGVADLVGETDNGPFVLDFKTDHAPTKKDAQARAKHHRPQLSVYATALARALDVPPRQVRTYIAFLDPTGEPANLVQLHAQGH